MHAEWLYRISLWVTYPIAAVLIFAAAEIGCSLGLHGKDRGRELAHSHITTIQSALLGLLALLIGFTFSIALSRYELHRTLIVDEANAIGTAALRAQFLPEGPAEKVAALLRDYTDTRLAGMLEDTDSQESPAAAHSDELLKALWAEAVGISHQKPESIPVSLFAQSVNDVTDYNEKRRIADHNRVPQVTFLLLFAMSAVAVGFTGYAAGLLGTRQTVPNAIIAVSIAVVTMLIADLDRPKHGLITVDRQALLDVRSSFSKWPNGAANSAH